MKDFICKIARTSEESPESKTKSFDAFMKNLHNKYIKHKKTNLKSKTNFRS